MIALAAASSAALMGGCQKVLPPKNEPVALIESQIPPQRDEATVRRDFEKSTLYYPNGTTVAGSTRFPLAPRAQAGHLERNLVEPALFLGNVVALPFTYLVKPPFEPYDWKGVVTPPSDTVQPAYPAESSSSTAGPGAGGDGMEATDGGPVPAAQSPVPGASEPVRNPSGEQPPLPTENQGVTEVTGTPPDANPQPVTPSGGTGGASGAGGAGAGGAGAP
jgi:hypothetical protein